MVILKCSMRKRINTVPRARHHFGMASGVLPRGLVSWLHRVMFSGVTAQKAVSYNNSLALSFWSV